MDQNSKSSQDKDENGPKWAKAEPILVGNGDKIGQHSEKTDQNGNIWQY